MTSERHVNDLFDLTGKVVLITGAGGYLGSAMCRALVEAGATVVASSRRAERARQVAEELEEIGGQHFGVELDHMDSGSIDQGFDEAVSLAGHVDILVNNGNEGVGGDLTTVNEEQFNRQLQNATGFFLLSRPWFLVPGLVAWLLPSRLPRPFLPSFLPCSFRQAGSAVSGRSWFLFF